MLDSFGGDLRYAARTLRKNPAFTAIAIATLALGIGATTAITGVVDAIVFRGLTYPHADRLVAIHEVVPKFAYLAPMIPVNAMHFREWRKNARSFNDMALIGGITLNLTGWGEPEKLAAARVTPALFSMLGMRAQLGRTLLPDEDQPGRDRVVVLDDSLWRRRFGADPSVIGRKITLDGNPYEIVGVLAPMHFPKLSQLFALTIAEERPQLWKPFALRTYEMDEMGDFNFACVARLKPGVSRFQAVADLDSLLRGITSRAPEKIEVRAAVVPLQEQITGRSRSGLELLLAAVAAVLLIGCVNIANLLLARGAGRRREIAVRAALGAGSGRLMRQMLVESLTIAAAGGIAGIGIAYAALRLIVAYAPVDLPRIDEVHLDLRTLLAAIAITAFTGLLFGLVPAWRYSRSDPQDAMKSSSRSTTATRGSARMRWALVMAEVALSAMCLIAGGLLLRSFVKLLGVDRGFTAESVVTVDLKLPSDRYPDTPKRALFLDAVLRQVNAAPGIASAGVSTKLPLSGEGNNNLIGVEGMNLPLTERPLADIRETNPDYFRIMGIPLYRGRVYDDSDRQRHVALISAIAAARIWPGQNPIGKRFRVGGDNSPYHEVIGVVGDVRGVSLNKQPTLTMYFPYWQMSNSEYSIVAKTASDAGAAATAIRAAIRSVDPQQPVPAFRTMRDIVSESVAPRRFQMDLVLLFAAAAMLLASLGIYGVVSYAVVQRTNEIGVRMALGARPSSVAALIFRQSLSPVALGLACGIVVSLALGRLLANLLFGITVFDRLTLAGVVLLLFAVAVIATFVPAQRAMRLDPSTALRDE